MAPKKKVGNSEILVEEKTVVTDKLEPTEEPGQWLTFNNEFYTSFCTETSEDDLWRFFLIILL